MSAEKPEAATDAGDGPYVDDIPCWEANQLVREKLQKDATIAALHREVEFWKIRACGADVKLEAAERELSACREKVTELDNANTGLASESHMLRTLLGALVDAVDETDDLDEMDGEEYQTASKNLEAAMSAARPHTEGSLIQRQIAIDAAIRGQE